MWTNISLPSEELRCWPPLRFCTWHSASFSLLSPVAVAVQRVSGCPFDRRINWNETNCLRFLTSLILHVVAASRSRALSNLPHHAKSLYESIGLNVGQSSARFRWADWHPEQMISTDCFALVSTVCRYALLLVAPLVYPAAEPPLRHITQTLPFPLDLTSVHKVKFH